jgi:hypothetical protein
MSCLAILSLVRRTPWNALGPKPGATATLSPKPSYRMARSS